MKEVLTEHRDFHCGLRKEEKRSICLILVMKKSHRGQMQARISTWRTVFLKEKLGIELKSKQTEDLTEHLEYTGNIKYLKVLETRMWGRWERRQGQAMRAFDFHAECFLLIIGSH